MLKIQFGIKLLLQIDQSFALNHIPTRTAIIMNITVLAPVCRPNNVKCFDRQIARYK